MCRCCGCAGCCLVIVVGVVGVVGVVLFVAYSVAYKPSPLVHSENGLVYQIQGAYQASRARNQQKWGDTIHLTLVPTGWIQTNDTLKHPRH